MMDTKALGVERGPNTRHMIRAIQVTGLALGGFMAGDAIRHDRQRKIGPITREHGTMTCHAVRVVSGVRESNVPEAFESGILCNCFSRRMTTEAFAGRDGSAESRPNTGLRMTRRTLGVGWQLHFHRAAAGFVAERAVGAETGRGVDPGL